MCTRRYKNQTTEENEGVEPTTFINPSVSVPSASQVNKNIKVFSAAPRGTTNSFVSMEHAIKKFLLNVLLQK